MDSKVNIVCNSKNKKINKRLNLCLKVQNLYKKLITDCRMKLYYKCIVMKYLNHYRLVIHKEKWKKIINKKKL